MKLLTTSAALALAALLTTAVVTLTPDEHDRINQRLDRIEAQLTPRPSPSRVSRSRALLTEDAAPSPAGTVSWGREQRTFDTTCYVASGNRTASGLWPRVGMAASNRWPFGTRLRVQRVGVVTVQDRIGSGSELDLFFASRAACIKFGRQRLLVEVLR